MLIREMFGWLLSDVPPTPRCQWYSTEWRGSAGGGFWFAVVLWCRCAVLFWWFCGVVLVCSTHHRYTNIYYQPFQNSPLSSHNLLTVHTTVNHPPHPTPDHPPPPTPHRHPTDTEGWGYQPNTHHTILPLTRDAHIMYPKQNPTNSTSHPLLTHRLQHYQHPHSSTSLTWA